MQEHGLEWHQQCNCCSEDTQACGARHQRDAKLFAVATHQTPQLFGHTHQHVHAAASMVLYYTLLAASDGPLALSTSTASTRLGGFDACDKWLTTVQQLLSTSPLAAKTITKTNAMSMAAAPSIAEPSGVPGAAAMRVHVRACSLSMRNPLDMLAGSCCFHTTKTHSATPVLLKSTLVLALSAS